MSIHKTKRCHTCGQENAKNSQFCSNCGGKYLASTYSTFGKWWFWLIVVVLIVFPFACIAADNVSTKSSIENSTLSKNTYVTTVASETTTKPTTTKSTTTKSTTTKPTTTQTSAKPTASPTPKPATLTEAQYKAQCVDLPWAEIVKDTKTYVGFYIKKDLMVRQLATISKTGETVYICGENKGGGSYVGGTFTVFDRRSNKKHPIELYDKIYVYGQITGIYMTWSSFDPEYKIKYVQFKGKFGE